MSPEEIKAGELLIQEFMGWKLVCLNPVLEEWEDESDYCYEFRQFNNAGEIINTSSEDNDWHYEKDSAMSFYYNWNRLMTVVDKVQSIYDDFHGYFGVMIYSNNCAIQGTKFNPSEEVKHYAYFADYTLETAKDSTFMALWDFIKWYNENLKNK